MFKRPTLVSSAAPIGIPTARWYTSPERELLVDESTYRVIAQVWQGGVDGKYHWNVMVADQYAGNLGAEVTRRMARYAAELRAPGFACIQDSDAAVTDKAATRTSDHVTACAKWIVDRLADEIARNQVNTNSRCGELRSLLARVLAASQKPHDPDGAAAKVSP